MKYQILITGGKIVIRYRRFFRFEYLRDVTGKLASFESEEAAVSAILARTSCEYIYEGAILREIEIERYSADR